MFFVCTLRDFFIKLNNLTVLFCLENKGTKNRRQWKPLHNVSEE